MSRLKGKITTGQDIKELISIGVYKMYHIKNKDMFYIGSAKRVNGEKACRNGFYRRFLEHIHFFENGKHNCLQFQKIINDLGVEGIRFEILEVLDGYDSKYILDREQFYMDTLKPFYNISKNSRCCVIEYTPERRKALSDRLKGKRLSQSAYDKIMVKVVQYDLSWNKIKEFNSIQEASESTGVERSSISRCIDGIRKRAGNFRWSNNNPLEAKAKGYSISRL